MLRGKESRFSKESSDFDIYNENYYIFDACFTPCLESPEMKQICWKPDMICVKNIEIKNITFKITNKTLDLIIRQREMLT